MYGNGAATGMVETIIAAVRQTILQAHHQALTACTAAVAGTTTTTAAVLRTVATATPRTAAAMLGFALCWRLRLPVTFVLFL